jgi:NAD(P)-dependent dehydrogenase (short-subunit alcohol dehydrogenase family)
MTATDDTMVQEMAQIRQASARGVPAYRKALAMAWQETDIPDMAGRTVLITGANSGLGLRCATVLAGKGARVLLACRSPQRGTAALDQVAEAATGPKPELVALDLASLSAIRDAVPVIREVADDRIHVLLNNAGVMGPPYQKTVDGFELQFGTNHLGHAALTWLLMPALRNAGTTEHPARVIGLSSIAAEKAQLDLDDFNFEHRKYKPNAAYGESKLATQSFALELDRRLRAAGEPVISVAAHPGYVRTNIGKTMAQSYDSALTRFMIRTGIGLAEKMLAQDLDSGAHSLLYAATAPEVTGGQYIGLDGKRQLKGNPTPVEPLPQASAAATRAALWKLTADLTGVAPDPAEVASATKAG